MGVSSEVMADMNLRPTPGRSHSKTMWHEDWGCKTINWKKLDTTMDNWMHTQVTGKWKDVLETVEI